MKLEIILVSILIAITIYFVNIAFAMRQAPQLDENIIDLFKVG